MVLIMPDDWHQVVHDIAAISFPKVVVIGLKGAGKSTFCRFLGDQLLTKFPSVCTLETDCGQPEHTAPGTISLTEKSRTGGSPIGIVSQRFLGFVNPGTNPFAYIETVELVHGDYATGFGSHPLIVNCHGWGSGTGKETWEAIITLVQPDFVVHIGTECAELPIAGNNPFLSNPDLPIPTPRWMPLSKVIVMDDSKLTQSSSSDKRWIKFASHFRPDLVRRDTFKSSPISSFFVSPFSRALELEVASVAITVPCCDEPPPRPIAAIESTVVGLCNAETGQCICMGFVASVDAEFVCLFIPPNIPARLADRIDLIVRGEVNWSPRDQVCHKGKTTGTDFTAIPGGEPFFLTNVLAGEGTGARVPSSRTNLKRRRLVAN